MRPPNYSALLKITTGLLLARVPFLYSFLYQHFFSAKTILKKVHFTIAHFRDLP